MQRAARSSATVLGPDNSTDPIIHAPPGSLRSTLTRPAPQGGDLAGVRVSAAGAARESGGADPSAAMGAAAAAAAAVAEAVAVAAAHLLDQANESLRELEGARAEAARVEAARAEEARVETLARVRGTQQKLGAGKTQQLADMADEMAQLEAAAVAAEAEAVAAETKAEAARAARRRRAAEVASSYDYGGACTHCAAAPPPLAQPSSDGGETMQAQIRWLTRGSGGGDGDEALAMDRSHYYCDPASRPPPTPRRLSLTAFGERLLQPPRLQRSNSAPPGVRAGGPGLLARTAGRLKRVNSFQKQTGANGGTLTRQGSAGGDDRMRA